MLDPRRIDPALRAKYDVRGPRYTSYPPATHFRPVEAPAVFARWRARNALDPDPGLSLYVHIPFCRARCLFCGCHTHIARESALVDRYVAALVREMELTAEIVRPSRPVVQIALGGGTPNYLEVAQLDLLLSNMERIWSITPDAERSVEIDPRTATQPKLDAFLAHGFNRISLGVQDLEPAVLERVRKGQDLMQVEEVVRYLREHGVAELNFDLIYGLPGQSLETAARTAEQVVRLRPTRLALYSYAHVPWVAKHQQVLEKRGLPDPDLKLALFLAMLDRFSAAGYEPIGMDHFALPEDRLSQALREGRLRRNFMGYTTGRGTDLLGFGASSIASVGSSYSQDDKDTMSYLQSVEQGTLPMVRGFLLSPEDELRRELIIDLFCNFFVDLVALGARFGVDAQALVAPDLAALEPMAADGLVTIDRGAVRVTETGRFFVRNVCMCFDRYLERDAGARQYSRTV
jgi:oxygen-independent coproporphyrinogen III oxidase